jgi:hypothetical protein
MLGNELGEAQHGGPADLALHRGGTGPNQPGEGWSWGPWRLAAKETRAFSQSFLGQAAELRHRLTKTSVPDPTSRHQ